MANIYKGTLGLIGNTPLVEVENIEKELNLPATLLVKLEYLNPAGSVKDRIAKAMIEDAEEKGILKKGSVIIEPTSGNTGIGLAAIAAVKGYRIILTMPETMSIERRNILKAYGAEIVLTEGARGMKGAIEKADELAKEIPDSFIPGQFVNPANAAMHRKTTGPEIYKDTDGAVDIFVAGVGTGGTLTGVGEYLKSVKECISNFLLLNLSQSNTEIIFNERFSLYSELFIENHDYSKIFGLYLALICEDNMTQGYEPFNPDTAIDNKLLSAVSSVLVSYYEQLINDCDTTIADIVSN